MRDRLESLHLLLEILNTALEIVRFLAEWWLTCGP